ncbi:hypothetical protein MKX03_032358, partial [Papaver bracteatum]
HFLPFNPIDKRTMLTYIDNESKMHRILNLANNKPDIERRVHAEIDRFEEQVLRSLEVAYQEVPKCMKESMDAPWKFVGLLPLFDPPRLDKYDTIKRDLELGVINCPLGKKLATGYMLGMGTNMYPSSALLGRSEDESVTALSVDELIDKANGFAGVFPDTFILIGFLVFDSEHKYEIVKYLQARKHICGMTGDGVDDAPALKKDDIGIDVAYSTDAACNASEVVLTVPCLNVIINAVLTSRAIFQRMKRYMLIFGS